MILLHGWFGSGGDFIELELGPPELRLAAARALLQEDPRLNKMRYVHVYRQRVFVMCT